MPIVFSESTDDIAEIKTSGKIIYSIGTDICTNNISYTANRL